MLLREKGARGKGRQPLSPPSTGETRSAVSAPDIGSKFRVARRSTSTCQKPGYFPRRKRHLSEGEPVYAFGYPLTASQLLVDQPRVVMGHAAYAPRVTSAIVASTMDRTAVASTPGDPKVYVLDRALNYGNSGGPVVAVQSGRVHALCSRFQAVDIPQVQWNLYDKLGRPPPIRIPSLYGIVSSLANANIIAELGKRSIPMTQD
jgi:serine protease Do